MEETGRGGGKEGGKGAERNGEGYHRMSRFVHSDVHIPGAGARRPRHSGAELARDSIVAFDLRAYVQRFASLFVRSQVRHGEEGFCELTEKI